MDYESFVRNRITELRLKNGVSEHKMSLELGKSGAYIRSITNGSALPSLKELFNIIDYFDISPSEFFSSLEQPETERSKATLLIQNMNIEDVDKVLQFIDWIKK
ncbi:MAG: helix-turn-helix transcriptional regulator [Oscillospiraceae bacterium]|nr:helix-turn-helix transcriptional regulator [Oscillospiraceae bacterium]